MFNPLPSRIVQLAIRRDDKLLACPVQQFHAGASHHRDGYADAPRSCSRRLLNRHDNDTTESDSAIIGPVTRDYPDHRITVAGDSANVTVREPGVMLRRDELSTSAPWQITLTGLLENRSGHRMSVEIALPRQQDYFWRMMFHAGAPRHRCLSGHRSGDRASYSFGIDVSQICSLERIVSRDINRQKYYAVTGRAFQSAQLTVCTGRD